MLQIARKLIEFNVLQKPNGENAVFNFLHTEVNRNGMLYCVFGPEINPSIMHFRV